MSPQERERKLRQAIAIVAEVRDSFSTEKEVCPHCGFEKFVYWDERQTRDQLNGALSRLERVAGKVNPS